MTESISNNPQSIDPAAAQESRHAWRVLLALTGVSLLITYVETMIIPGVPAIQTDFKTTADITSWITSALLIVGSAVSPLFGKLGDTYGKKLMFLVALTFYMAGVGIAGFAPSIYFLIVARAIQGVGFAIMPLALAIITDIFPKERVATAQGVISGTFAIGASAGLTVGAYVVQDLSWRWAFHTAFLLSLVLFGVVAAVLKRDRPTKKSKVDYIGATILIAGITLMLVYLTEGPTIGWYSLENLAFLIPGAILTVSFFFYQTKANSPLIQMSLLRIRNVLISNIVGLISGMVMFLIFFGVIYYAELKPIPFGLGLSVIQAGLVLAPATLVMLLVGPFLGRMTSRLGPKPLLLFGALVSGLGSYLFVVHRATSTDLTVDAAVTFIGLVSVMIPIVNMISISLPRENVAVGLGMNTMLRNVGGAIGPVVATTIMTTYTTPITINIAGQIITLGKAPSSYAFSLIFSIAVIVMIVIAVMSLFIKNYTFRKNNAKPVSVEADRTSTSK